MLCLSACKSCAMPPQEWMEDELSRHAIQQRGSRIICRCVYLIELHGHPSCCASDGSCKHTQTANMLFLSANLHRPTLHLDACCAQPCCLLL